VRRPAERWVRQPDRRPAERSAWRPAERPAASSGLSSAAGQATLEALGLIPLMLVVGLGVMQLLAVGYASALAGGAAEAGALALAAGRDPRVGAREALPGWSEARAQVSVDGGRVEVRLRPPSLLQVLSEELEVKAAAAVEAP
jgi:hypothetical protein